MRTGFRDHWHLPVRITVRRPTAGVVFAVQRGASELLSPSVNTPDTLEFDFTVRVAPATPGVAPRLLGEFTQGPPAARFVYVNSGRCAGQTNTGIARRAKVPLTGITNEMVASIASGAGSRLETAFEGTGSDGWPTCATVKSIEWRIVKD